MHGPRCPGKVVALAVILAAAPAAAEDERPVTREEFEKLQRELEGMKRQGLAAGASEAPGAAAAPGGFGALYETRPALNAVIPRTYIGGYFDVELMDAENARHDFRFHRFVPFFAADIHERVKFASELEIEDGGEEVLVEFAYVDLVLFREASVRGGVLLDPLGRFNLLHDSPINDLTDRPLVDQFVIPTTFREVGAGLFGTLTREDWEWEVKYEAYVTSGFKGLSDDPGAGAQITRSSGVRGARATSTAFGTRSFGDNNNSFAGVGRVSVSPFLGTEVGASAHHGAYDEDGDNDLTIAAVDALYTPPPVKAGDAYFGRFEVLGEGAYAFVERNGFAKAQGVADDLWGYYGQVNYHFLPEYFLPEGTKLTTALFPQSTFTLVGRWDQVDLDGNRRQRWTVGLNFRPVESTVVKLDYQFNRGTGKASDSADDDALLVSLASYF
ncbi:MAG: hypothetical protein HY721_02770 [Planctomycetes bacterium]|nr:hypothetical protein [Planctomycetota bacterium]